MPHHDPLDRAANRAPLALAFVALLAGCHGDIGSGVDPLAPPPPDVAPKNVPAAPDVIASSGFCVARATGETLASVSPEGHAWLVTAQGATTTVRVLDPFDAASTDPPAQSIELASVSRAQAWSAADASLVADGGLWSLDDMARVELTAPEGFVAPAEICGDPSDNGYLLAGGTLFEHRADDQWWAWHPEVDSTQAPRRLLGFDGECLGQDNVSWMTSDDGTLWRVEPAQVTFPVQFAALRDAVATESMVAVLDGERLWIGPEWQPWIFASSAPSELSAAAGRLWMMAGSQLLRSDGDSWVEVAHDMPEPVVQIAAHAGGVWLLGDSSICHRSTGPMLRIEGARPFARTDAGDVDFTLTSDTPEATLSAEQNGMPLIVTDGGDGSLTVHGALDEVGWHRFRLIATTDAEQTVRSLLVKRIPAIERSWATDIQPIYAANCTGSSCHGTSPDRPALDSYQAWQDYAGDIRQRVVEAQTMPPASSRGPDWNDQTVEIISEWLEGGMLP